MFDYKAFARELGMASEDQSALDALFGKYPDAPSKIDSVLTAQVEARVQPLQAEIAKKQGELDEQFTVLGSIRSGDAKAVEDAEKRIELLSGQMATLTERVKRVARETGVDADTLLKDLLPVASVDPPRQEPNALDPSRIEAAMNAKTWLGVVNTAILEDLVDEHRALFPGQTFNRSAFLKDYQDTLARTNNGNLSLRDVFDKKFNVQARRDEMAEQKVQQRIQEAVQRKVTEMNDEIALRGNPMPEMRVQSATQLDGLLRSKDSTAHVAQLPDGVSAAIIDIRKRRAERLAKSA